MAARCGHRAAVEDAFRRFFEGRRAARIRDGRPMVQELAPRDLQVQRVGADAWQVTHWHASSPPPQPAGG